MHGATSKQSINNRNCYLMSFSQFFPVKHDFKTKTLERRGLQHNGICLFMPEKLIIIYQIVGHILIGADKGDPLLLAPQSSIN